MKSKFVLFFTLALILILNACSPFVISSSSDEQPTPEVETLPAPRVTALAKDLPGNSEGLVWQNN